MSLLKSAGRVGALTLASRFLGFFRDQLSTTNNSLCDYWLLVGP